MLSITCASCNLILRTRISAVQELQLPLSRLFHHLANPTSVFNTEKQVWQQHLASIFGRLSFVAMRARRADAAVVEAE
jgi:hypothetical protein